MNEKEIDPCVARDPEVSDDLAHAAADFACAVLPRAPLGRDKAIKAARDALAGGEFNTLFREYVRAFVAAAQWIDLHKSITPKQSDGSIELLPMPMILHCPECSKRHIDAGEFATRPHHTHACQHCGIVWRPAIVPTVGVQFLPGFKNEARAQ